MGLIIKQSIKGSFWSYLGVILGFITTSFLFPKYVSTEVIGLFGVIVAYSTIASQLSSLGIKGVTVRLFPYFRNESNGHNGFLFIGVSVVLIGFVLFLAVFSIISPYLLEGKADSVLLIDYFFLIKVVTLFVSLYAFFDSYIKLLYDAVYGTFLQEFVQRLLILLFTVLFIFKIIDINVFILAYALALSMKGVLIIAHLWRKKSIKLKPNLSFITPKLRKEIISVALFSLLAGFGTSAVFSIDKIIIFDLLDLSNTGVYTIAFFFGTLVVIPSRPLLKIAGTIIAEAWKDNDLEKIDLIYKKSCLNQFILGCVSFLGIWVNIDNILEILGDDYLEAKWVIFFIGLSFLIDMGTGAKNLVIGLSKQYRMMLLFISLLIVLVIVSNYIFIPIWGIQGAAIASAISMFVTNLVKYLFIYRKYGFQPFNYRFLVVISIFILSYITQLLLPELSLIPDIITRSFIVGGSFSILILVSKVSSEINSTVKKGYDLIKSKL